MLGVLLHIGVPEVVIIGVLGVIRQNMIGSIETVQNRHLFMDETAKIMIIKEADYESSRKTPGIAQL
ncbi:hypothetical protein Tco_0886273 [Tanacetum coccineum]